MILEQPREKGRKDVQLETYPDNTEAYEDQEEGDSAQGCSVERYGKETVEPGHSASP